MGCSGPVTRHGETDLAVPDTCVSRVTGNAEVDRHSRFTFLDNCAGRGAQRWASLPGQLSLAATSMNFRGSAMDLHTESAELNSSALGCKVGNDTALYVLGWSSVQIRYN